MVVGGPEETTELLKHKFDYILYTGSTPVGKIIMKAAAEHLTPVTLELGGKSPVIIDTTTDIKLAAKRIAWGKLLNSGQSCIAPDYILLLPGIEKGFIDAYSQAVIEMLGENQKESDSFGRIINKRHFDRIKKYLSDGTIVFGGETDEDQLYIQPTLIQSPSLDSEVMQNEIFGPVLPFITINSIDEAIDFINDRPKPLALYLFSNDARTIERVKHATSSGGYVVNDTMVHFTCNTLPFGGVGDSGMGGYHGGHSFATFSHMKPVLHKSTALESTNSFRYAPYNHSKLSTLQFILGYPKP